MDFKKGFFIGLMCGLVLGLLFIPAFSFISEVFVSKQQTDEDLIIHHFHQYPPHLHVYFENVTGYCTSSEIPQEFSYFYCDVGHWEVTYSKEFTVVNVTLEFPYFHFINYTIVDANLTFTDNNTYTHRLVLIEFWDLEVHTFYFEFELNTSEILEKIEG